MPYLSMSSTSPTTTPSGLLGLHSLWRDGAQSATCAAELSGTPTAGKRDATKAGGPHPTLSNLRVPHFPRSLREVGTVMPLGAVLDPTKVNFVHLRGFLSTRSSLMSPHRTPRLPAQYFGFRNAGTSFARYRARAA